MNSEEYIKNRAIEILKKRIEDYLGRGDYKSATNLANETDLREFLSTNKAINILKRRIERYLAEGDYKSAMNLANKTNLKEFLSRKVNTFNFGTECEDKLNNYLRRGQRYHNRGMERDALYFHKKALNLTKLKNDYWLEAFCLNNIGDVYYYLSNDKKAFENFRKSIKICKKIGDKGNKLVSLIQIGLIYYDKNELDKALDTFKKSISICKDSGKWTKRIEAYYFNLFGFVFMKKQKYRNAIVYFRKSLQIFKELKDLEGKCWTLFYIGRLKRNFCLNKKKLIEIIPFYVQALEISEALKLPYAFVIIAEELAWIHSDLDDFKQQKYYFDKTRVLIAYAKGFLFHCQLNLNEIKTLREMKINFKYWKFISIKPYYLIINKIKEQILSQSITLYNLNIQPKVEIIEDKKNKQISQEDNIIKDKIENINAKNTISSRIVLTREGQFKFREQILKRYNKTCCVCGIRIPELVQGCHIKPWRDSSDEEKGDIGNGVCLCLLHHKLFDLGFFTFTDNGKILISSKFKSKLKSYPEKVRLFFDYDGKMAIWTEQNAPDKIYLIYHRKNIFKKEESFN